MKLYLEIDKVRAMMALRGQKLVIMKGSGISWLAYKAQ